MFAVIRGATNLTNPDLTSTRESRCLNVWFASLMIIPCITTLGQCCPSVPCYVTAWIVGSESISDVLSQVAEPIEVAQQKTRH